MVSGHSLNLKKNTKIIILEENKVRPILIIYTYKHPQNRLLNEITEQRIIVESSGWVRLSLYLAQNLAMLKYILTDFILLPKIFSTH